MIQWERQWARAFSLHRMEGVILSLFSKWAAKFLGRSISNAIVFKEGANVVICQDKVEKEEALNSFFRSVKNIRSYRRFEHSYLDINRRFLEFGKKVFQTDFSKWSDNKLIGFYKKFTALHHEHMLVSQWLFFYLAEMFPERIKKEISPVIKSSELEKCIEVVFTPTITSQIIKEHWELLKIAGDYQLKKIKNLQEFDRRIDAHTLKYQWIPVIDLFLDKPWTKDYFTREFKKILKDNPAQKLRDVNKKFAKNKKEWERVLKMKIWSQKQQQLLKIAHLVSFYKDDRDDNRRKAYFYLKKMYQEMARRLGMTLKNLSFLTSEEIFKALRNKKPPLTSIEERKKLFLLLFKNKKIEVLTGKKAKVIIDDLLKEEVKLMNQKILGIVVMKGKIRGRVKIVKTKLDLNKVKAGNIMVAVTTHPDFVPAMRKSGAIITDEGGLLSHAAIVSRELKIPCIVNTKNATKILRDGQLVEVEATKGVVRVLKK